MIEKMNRYSFILFKGEEEKFLEELQGLGVVDIKRSSKPVDAHSEGLLSEAESLKRTIDALSLCEDGGKPVSCTPEEAVGQTVALGVRIAALTSELVSLRKEEESREPWGEFDPERLAGLTSLGYTVRYYAVQAKQFEEGWKELYPLTVVSRNKTSVWFVTVSDDPGYSFPVGECPAPVGPASECREKAKACAEEISSCKSKISGLKAMLPVLEKAYQEKVSQLDLYMAGVTAEKAAENTISTLEGFVPCSAPDIDSTLDGMNVFYVKEEATTQDNPPIKLKNNAFVRMFEVLTDMYGRPSYDGFDPTPFISIFFMLFFAFCMGDLGYGIIILAAGLALKRVKSFASMATLVSWLGGATIVIGFIFHTFFSMDISQWGCIPSWMKACMLPAKISGFDGTMALALIVGIVHLCTAMIVKTIYATKQKGVLGSLSVWGWTVFLVGTVVTAVVYLMGVIDMALTKWIVIGLGCCSAVGIFLLNDLHRNPLINIGAGLWETYNTATGLLGDVLSYLRLYALGLAGSMLGFAFNDLGKMILGDGGFGLNWIFFILVIVIGHTLNIAMAALGAFVHPLRLNFLEFFKNSGYEGSGRNYNPLSNNQ